MDTKKHAYLIMAHNNFYCLEKLLLLLDDERNDIYLHIDKKVKDFNFACFASLCHNARLMFPKKRMDVRWGTQSQVDCEMLLFETAVKNGPYHYYHLLSGSDLPLKSQNRMHDFFAERTECFMTVHEELTEYDYRRISRYHRLFGSNERLNGYADLLQEKLKVDRVRRLRGMTVRRGWNWVSLPQSAAALLVERKRWIHRVTRFSVCADEMYKQLVLLNSQEQLYSKDGKCTSLRFVDWKRREGSHPHIFTAEDLPLLVQAEALFARKFDEKVDKVIIDLVCDYVRGKG